MTRHTRWLAAGAFAVFLAVPGPDALAQFASAVEGTVTDSTHAVLPGVTVSIINEATGTAQTVTTTRTGYYRFPALPVGFYTMRFELEGFGTMVREHIRVQAAETVTQNVALELGSTEDEITVIGAAPLVETAEGRVSGLIDERQVQELPIIGRNFYSLVVLTPGVTGRTTGGSQAYAQANADLYNNEFGVNMNANGARTESNNFLVDSSTVSSSQRSGVVNVNPNAESVEEVRISVNNFSAEYGRNGSVLVNVLTKSGTNNLRGSFATHWTNNALQGLNQFERQTPGFEHPDFSRTELSWGVGGPIARDRTFFFVSGDVLRSDVAISRTSSVVTPQFIELMERQRPDNLSTFMMSRFRTSFTPDRNLQTAGQQLGIACSGASPIDSPIGPVPCNVPVTGEGLWTDTSPRNGFQWTSRLDHHFRDGRDRVFGSINRTTLDKVGFGEPSVYPDFTAPSPTNSLHVNANWTKILSPSVVNEGSFSWVRPGGELTNPHPDIPGISVSGIVGYQTTWGPNVFVQNSFVWRDVMTMTRGSHTLKLGGEYTREHADNDSSPSHQRAVYSFDSVFDFAADSPTTQTQLAIDPRTGDPITSLERFHRTQSVSAFVQNDWKVKPNLTVNLGLRYEAFLNVRNAAGLTSNMELGPGDDLRTRLESGRMIEQEYLLDGGLWGGGQHTLAPRASFAWDPANDGTMSLRGGIGRAYERMSNQIFDSNHLNLPGFAVVTASIFDPTVRPLFGFGTRTEQPFGFPFPTGVTGGVNDRGGLINGAGQVITVDQNMPAMYLDNWFLGAQRAIGPNAVVEADYIGSRGRNMYVRWNINRFNGDLLDGQLDRVLPGFSSILHGQAIDRSQYHGVTTALKVSRGELQAGAAYTFGKATDLSSSATPPERPDAFGPLDQEEGPADHDIRHKLAVSANWRIPGPTKGAARAVLDGWQIAGVVIAQSGSPFTVICSRGFVPIRNAAGTIVGNAGCDFNADGTNRDRPMVPAFGDSLRGLSNGDFLNGIFTADDFPTPPLGQSGDLGRNTFRGPRFFNVDLALIKSIRAPITAGRGADVQLRLEAFNAFNTTNLLNPVSDLASPELGRSTSALPGRILQISARIAF